MVYIRYVDKEYFYDSKIILNADVGVKSYVAKVKLTKYILTKFK